MGELRHVPALQAECRIAASLALRFPKAATELSGQTPRWGGAGASMPLWMTRSREEEEVRRSLAIDRSHSETHTNAALSSAIARSTATAHASATSGERRPVCREHEWNPGAGERHPRHQPAFVALICTMSGRTRCARRLNIMELSASGSRLADECLDAVERDSQLPARVGGCSTRHLLRDLDRVAVLKPRAGVLRNVWAPPVSASVALSEVSEGHAPMKYRWRPRVVHERAFSVREARE